MADPEVLVVGAGPTGLVLALWLARRGVRVRVVDQATEAGTTSRALAVHARTLEFYAQLGIADAVVSQGRRATGINLWVAGRRVAHARFGGIGAGLSPYPFVLIFPQDEHERFLIEQLAASGVVVERETSLVRVAEQPDGISAELRLADGRTEICQAQYLAGCDGAHSTTREQLHIGFPGGTYEHVFYVADVDGHGDVLNAEVHVALDREDFLIAFPLEGSNHVRLIGTVREAAATRGGRDLSWDDVSHRVLGWIKIDVDRVRWFSTYHVHHRVADRFRSGRAFLLGDAAHIHSPVGGQGMNTGIGDAVDLGWRLVDVLRRHAPASLLDSFEPERVAFAERLVDTTDRAFTAVTSSSALARFVRLRVIPLVVPALFASEAARRFMFRTVSQTTINYRESALSEGRVGGIHGGDRLPWVPLDGDVATSNFTPLTTRDWQVHVYGAVPAGLGPACEERRVPLHAFPWQDAMAEHGLSRDTVCLVRPDGYIASIGRRDRVATVLQSIRAVRDHGSDNDVTLGRGPRRWTPGRSMTQSAGHPADGRVIPRRPPSGPGTRRPQNVRWI